MPTSLYTLDRASLLDEMDDMATRWSSNVRLSLSEEELARYASLKEALREQGHYDCRIVRAPNAAGQYTVEFDPL
ncbi:hypothetical protein [Lysobacter olei]